MQFSQYTVWLTLLLTSSVQANAWFYNQEQQAQAAFTQGNYGEAAQLFTDPYRRGVALYRNGHYAEAIEAFNAVTRPEVKLDALYNSGNAHFQQEQYEQAIASYEQVLAQRPDDADTRHNLALAKQRLADSQPPAPQPQENQQDSAEKQPKQDQNNSQQSEQQNADTAEQQQDQKNQSDAQSASPDNAQSVSDATQNDSSPSAQPPQQTSSEKQESSETSGTPSPAKLQNEELAHSTNTDRTHTTPINEAEMMADTLLNRLKENPRQLMEGQFKIDAYYAKQANTPLPQQDW